MIDHEEGARNTKTTDMIGRLEEVQFMKKNVTMTDPDDVRFTKKTDTTELLEKVPQ
jgi:hypothetical protein